MISNETRKESIRKFKERKPLVGIYAVRCTATGRVWVGAFKNLDAAKNRCWFSLRNGLHRETTLQEEWNAHGESAFQYEVLEGLDPDVHPLEVDGLLKNRRKDWIGRLGAHPLL